MTNTEIRKHLEMGKFHAGTWPVLLRQLCDGDDLSNANERYALLEFKDLIRAWSPYPITKAQWVSLQTRIDVLSQLTFKPLT